MSGAKKHRPAGDRETVFITGNGINNYLADPEENSWRKLLEDLGTEYSGMDRKFITDVLSDHSVTYPEFFDLVQLLSDTAPKPEDVRKIKAEIGRKFNSWKPRDHHRAFITSARGRGTPVLTTNFDYLLESSDTGILEFMKSRTRSSMAPLRFPGTDPSRTFPWHSYYSDRLLDSAFDGFGIWHIHGMGVYPQSIRLSLSDYMGAVERARLWLHAETGNPFNSPGSHGSWKGRNSWLDLFLHRNLFIFGLALESQEVSIRWLLIEREKYYRKHPGQRKQGWYALVKEFDQFPEGKRLFFENLGFEILEFASGKELYEDFWEAF